MNILVSIMTLRRGKKFSEWALYRAFQVVFGLKRIKSQNLIQNNTYSYLIHLYSFFFCFQVLILRLKQPIICELHYSKTMYAIKQIIRTTKHKKYKKCIQVYDNFPPQSGNENLSIWIFFFLLDPLICFMLKNVILILGQQKILF